MYSSYTKNKEECDETHVSEDELKLEHLEVKSDSSKDKIIELLKPMQKLETKPKIEKVENVETKPKIEKVEKVEKVENVDTKPKIETYQPDKDIMSMSLSELKAKLSDAGKETKALEIAETETKAAPRPDWTAFLIASIELSSISILK